MGFPPAPPHLGTEAQAVWNRLQAAFAIDDAAGQLILTAGLEAFERAARARLAINQQGEARTDAAGRIHANPLCAIERDQRAAWLSALRMLQLDHSQVATPSGMKPRRPGRK